MNSICTRTYKTNLFPLIALSLLTLLLISTSFCFVLGGNSLSASAATENQKETNLKVKVNTTLSISNDATGGINLNFSPTQNGTLDTKDVDVTVITNNPTGYSLLMNSQSTQTGLVHETIATNIVPSTTADYNDPTELSLNTWGFNKWQEGQTQATDTFSAIPSSSNPLTIKTTDSLTPNDITTFTFGAKIGNITAGQYINNIVFTATANYVPPSTDGDMQTFTKDQCNALAPGTTKKLKDTRDNKIYQVRKMADGNCWMVDNLAYDIGTAQDVPVYNPSAQLVSEPMAPASNIAQYALNPDYTIPNGGSPTPTYLYNWCAALGDTSANCYASANAPQYGTVQGSNIVQGSETDQAEVTGICPEPFRLPKGGPEATSIDPATTANEFAKLDIAMDGTGAYRENATNFSSWTGTEDIDKNWGAVMSGRYGYDGLVGQGSYGPWWSSTAYYTTYAYSPSLSLTGAGVRPVDSGEKYYGVAVRCVL